MYQRLLPRVRELGGSLRLCSVDGAVLSGEPATGLLPPTVADKSAVSRSATMTESAVWIPIGNGQTDCYLHVSEIGTPTTALTLALEWSAKDADRIFQLEDGTTQLGDRLAENYEQMHVLFGLARVLDGVEDVHAGVVQVLEKVRAGLPFTWVAIQFGKHAYLRREVAGKLILSGTCPCDSAKVSAGCSQLLRASNLTGLRMIFPGDACGLAERFGTELAAVPLKYEGQTVAVLLAGGKTGDDAALSSFETQFLSACTDLLSVFHENLTRFADQRSLFVGTVHALTSAIDAKHPYTRGHSERVALLAREMAKAIGLSEQTRQAFHLSGLLHDVGKIGVSEAILSKPTRLTDAEFEAIKLHPRIGYEILKDIPRLDEVLPGVLHHHEAFAGKGYPDGLVGEEIPLIGRVLALCDTFDAMSSTRSYRDSMSREAVLAEIRKCSGRQFDPALAEVFLNLDFAPFDTLFASHAGKLSLAA